jgi:hypothetical protein
VALTGGHAEISVPAGTTHDLWTSGRDAPRIMQYADDADFEFVVKFDSAMGTKNQAQGVLVEGDAQNYCALTTCTMAPATKYRPIPSRPARLQRR